MAILQQLANDFNAYVDTMTWHQLDTLIFYYFTDNIMINKDLK